ncbi:helix-turn-helix transcriptional regulator [Marinifilum flexuosum]|uniref:Putative DNA-binding transcriptional regulator YafY n=1 Tax=Marinifilum flexuosum TaxID=1117708 RepID=A0A419X8Z3_9BACT|nr:WYL domain-containing protein [Marinifilum flexuosum]RKE04175.1 putative DNA-binding transcriptional regulator YafY [Marinifilum flexuosum]
MSQQATIKRYLLVLEKVKRGFYPSRQDLIDYLNDQGLKCSTRTFQRILESIRNEFGVEIKYNSHKQGYYIDQELSDDFEPFIRLLEMSQSANTIIETLSEGKDAMQFIHFDSSSLMQGIHYLKPLLRAIRDSLQIKIQYSYFYKEEERSFILNPEFLKEYMNRWYVVGHVDYTEGERVYALDRIKSVELLSDTFTKKLGAVGNYFDDIIGVNFSGEEVKKVVLSFSPHQGNYIRTLPLHHSQEIIVDNKDEFRISIRVKPNFELKQRIQMYGDQVKVIEPELF